MSIRIYQVPGGRIRCEMYGATFNAASINAIRDKSVGFLEMCHQYIKLCEENSTLSRLQVNIKTGSTDDVGRITNRLSRGVSKGRLRQSSDNLCTDADMHISVHHSQLMYTLHRIVIKYPNTTGTITTYNESDTPLLVFEIINGKIVVKPPPPIIQPIESSSMHIRSPSPDIQPEKQAKCCGLSRLFCLS